MQLKAETLVQFYQRTNQQLPVELANRNQTASHFNIKRRLCQNRVIPYNRRDYYKICLIIGSGTYRFKNKEIPVEEGAIIFSNPMLPSSWESNSEMQDGYYCLFNDAFLLNNLRHDIRQTSALYNPLLTPIHLLKTLEINRLSRHFSDMIELLSLDYSYKYEMIKHELQLLILEDIRLRACVPEARKLKPSDRIVSNFFHLLNQQFPVDSAENPLRLTTPSEYASQLNVHVNHLNAVIKNHTGKTTRKVIGERVVLEAKTLLHNTSWDVSEIAYSLGFEYPSHFNKYFKQHTNITPLVFRHQNNGII